MSQEEELLDVKLTGKSDFKSFDFPLTFQFKIGTMANDFVAKDANGNTIAYVRQKMFKFKEAVKVYENESKSNLMYEINADRIIDFNASYQFTNPEGELLGSIGRKGMKSLWRANYQIFDTDKNSSHAINEENPWSKVFDVLFSEIPIAGIFTGYIFNPKYLIKTNEGNPVARLSKEASFFGRKFKLEKLDELKDGDNERLLLSLMMMILLERRRG